MSDILFLGTGAADWKIAERDGFFRRNSAALINGELMLDCGEHIFDFSESINCTGLYEKVTDIIITHDHPDHFNKDSVLKIADLQKIRVCCCKRISEIIGPHRNIEYVLLNSFKVQRTGNYEIIPLLANHQIVTDGDYSAYQYIIKTADGKTVFYGLDGAWFLRPSWEEMKKHKFNIMIFDCTAGDKNDWRLFEHNTIPMLRMMTEGIKNAKILEDDAVLVASHFAKKLHGSHEETAGILEKDGIMAAYDGMKLIF